MLNGQMTFTQAGEYVGITDTRGFNRARPLYIDEIGFCMQSLLRRFRLDGYTESLEEASYENVYGKKRAYEESCNVQKKDRSFHRCCG